jgi:hypothetical protein
MFRNLQDEILFILKHLVNPVQLIFRQRVS